jgi:hypothetical protein
MFNENDENYLPIPELRNGDRLGSQDFSSGNVSLSFAGIAATGDSAAQAITDRNFLPVHIGAVPAQPVNAYLMIRDVFASIFGSGGTELYEGVIVYRDTKRVEHIIANISGTVAVGASFGINIPRLRLISENAIGDRDRVNLGEIFVRTNVVSGAGSVTVRVYCNLGVQYAA